MGLAACTGAEAHHGTTHVTPVEPNRVEDAGEPQTSMKQDYCTLTAEELEAHKRCEVDADCAPLSYRPTCCANTLLVGVSQSSLEELDACVAKQVPVCACEAAPNRGEDGRAVLDGFTVQMHCEAGRCASAVTERSCGSKLKCGAGEICVSYGDALRDAPEDAGPSDNAYVAYTCLPNPCVGKLDCTCAQSACDARSSLVQRKCEIARNDDSDVACVPYRD